MQDRSDSDPESVIGDECHIVGQKIDGPRGANTDRGNIDEYENLVLLCKTHHKLVDDQPTKFSVEFLCSLKTVHENWVKQSLEPLKQKGQQLKIWLLDRIHTGKELMAVFEGVCTHLLDHDEPQSEQEMELLGNFLQDVQDWIDARGDIESSGRVRAGFELSKRIKELEAVGFYVFALPVKQRIKLNDKTELWPSGILTVVRKSNPGITALGQLASLLKVGANSFPSD
ncbi:MAG: hypothetical protein KIS67_17750 [Verrucomicrobiae bacterium]|nr:hypothetical protein [Verrucomicrobiae bacterium]